MKKTAAVLLSVVLGLSAAMSSMAGEWKSDSVGWWWVKDDGSYSTSAWENINGAWYYFYDNGYMAHDTWIGNYYVGSTGAMFVNATTPDGYRVGADGAWIPDHNNIYSSSTVSTSKLSGNFYLANHPVSNNEGVESITVFGDRMTVTGYFKRLSDDGSHYEDLGYRTEVFTIGSADYIFSGGEQPDSHVTKEDFFQLADQRNGLALVLNCTVGNVTTATLSS